ncbi:DUF2971 domain-containing protein [Marinifilum fragile]|uniref:DUF2971 domain-containing protein n=1 Tax=Marinifilum fragile TaxID=570161 RepID=UPI002AA75F31|nr:DUF2971 domain-containing protein [Marinifilum fragile]
MFKYSPINSYSLRNLQKNQIFFNNPLNFNDPFDTFHPAKIKGLSDQKFVDLYCDYSKREFDKKALLGIINKNISKQDFYNFCEEHIDYIFDFNDESGNQIFKNKSDFLEQLNNIEELNSNFVENIGSFFSAIKLKIQESILQTLQNIRQESFSKIGVCCFSKNNSNLLMWSHYADNHQGFCLEFDSNIKPFSKTFEVTYESEIPDINLDLLYNEKDELDFIEKLLSFKSIDWKYEEELRIFHKESNKSYFYPAHSLKAIYFGIRANQSDIEIICSIIKSQNPSVKFYRMKKQEVTFGVIPEEFFYSTAMEVQSSLLLIISEIFKDNEFTVNQLLNRITNNITENQLIAHLEDLSTKNMLNKNDGKYLLKVKNINRNKTPQ